MSDNLPHNQNQQPGQQDGQNQPYNNSQQQSQGQYGQLPQPQQQQYGQQPPQTQQQYQQPQGQYGQQGQYQQPQGQYQNQPAGPVAPNPFGLGFGAVWNAFLDIFKSNPVGAHDRMQQNPVWGWIISTALQALMAGLAAAVFLNSYLGRIIKLMAVPNSNSSSLPYNGTPVYTGGEGFVIFLIFFVLTFGVLALRGVALMLVARIGQSNMSYTSAMSVVGTSIIPLIPTYLLIALFSIMLPTPNKNDVNPFTSSSALVLIILGVFVGFCIIMGEALLYLGFMKVANTQKSVFLMYVLLTTAFVLVALIVYCLLGGTLTPAPSGKLS